jgi:hypothetical protein
MLRIDVPGGISGCCGCVELVAALMSWRCRHGDGVARQRRRTARSAGGGSCPRWRTGVTWCRLFSPAMQAAVAFDADGCRCRRRSPLTQRRGVAFLTIELRPKLCYPIIGPGQILLVVFFSSHFQRLTRLSGLI